MTTPNGKPTRITIDLSPKSYARLEALEDIVGAASKSEVVREALRLYEYVAKQTQAGAKFLVDDGSGDMKRILIMTDPGEDEKA